MHLMMAPHMKHDLIERTLDIMEEKGADASQREMHRKALEASVAVSEPVLVNIPTTEGHLAAVSWNHPDPIEIDLGPKEARVQVIPTQVLEQAIQGAGLTPDEPFTSESLSRLHAELRRQGWDAEIHGDPVSQRWLAVGRKVLE